MSGTIVRTQEPPRLVVGIVVDQMRFEYLYKYQDHYSEGGFKRLIREGYSFRNTHYNYIPTVTAAGHASIYTGTTPSVHGIVGNSWYERESARTVSNVGDTTVRLTGSVIENPAGLSPRRLRNSTITDALRLQTDLQAKVISVSLKDRGAILPGGQQANAAYWYDWESSPGHFVSSTYYMEELPRWVRAFNGKEKADAYLSKTWNTLLSLDEYDESAPDDNPHETMLRGKESPTFPYDFEAMRALYEGSTSFYQVLWVTPFGNTLLKDFAIEAMQEEDLGKDEITDFLCISFSAPDAAGHTFGPQSVEVEDIYLRLDRDIAHLLRVLDRKVGKGEYTVFLTSDHGVSPVVSYALKNDQPAGLVVLPRIQQNLNFFLSTKYGAREWISNVGDHEIYLNRALLAEHGVSLEEMQRSVAEFLSEQPGVHIALTAKELQDETFTSGLPAMLQKGFLAERSGDVLMAYEPGFEPTWDFRTPIEQVRGAGHGSGYPQDTHVPLVWMGKGIPQGESSRLVHPVDIAPTLAKILDLEDPSAMSGKALEELSGN